MCEHYCHHGINATSNVFQSLNELEFERGIWHAAQTGDFDRLRKLIQRGEDVDRTDLAGYTALHYASRNGFLEICNYLIRNGANVDAITRAGRATALHRACSTGNSLVVFRLLLFFSFLYRARDRNTKASGAKR